MIREVDIRFMKSSFMGLNNKLKEIIFYKILFRLMPRRMKFSTIYKYNLWNSGESLSGPGSEISKLPGIEKFLKSLIQELNIKSILDIPCGDFNWMKTVDLSGIKYVGADIIKDLVRQNRTLYGSGSKDFVVLDIIQDELPTADLVIIKDLFIHFSIPNILKSLENVRRSGSKYILTTTFPDVQENIRIKDGYNFNINLQVAPFSFGKPLYFFEEIGLQDPKHGRRGVGLWEIERLVGVSSGYTMPQGAN